MEEYAQTNTEKEQKDKICENSHSYKALNR